MRSFAPCSARTRVALRSSTPSMAVASLIASARRCCASTNTTTGAANSTASEAVAGSASAATGGSSDPINAVDPYALARDDPEAMARIKARFEEMLLVGPMPLPNQAHRLPRKVEGVWLTPTDKMNPPAASPSNNGGDGDNASAHSHTASSSFSSSAASPLPHEKPAPFMPPMNLPAASEVEGHFSRFTPSGDAEEKEAMMARIEADDRARRAGLLYRVHEACAKLEAQRRGGGDTNSAAAPSSPSAATEENAMDDIDMLMGVGSSSSSSPPSSDDGDALAALLKAHHAAAHPHADPYAPFWDMFASKKGDAKKDGNAPEWFVNLCKDLFLRTTTAGAAVTPPELQQQQAQLEASSSSSNGIDGTSTNMSDPASSSASNTIYDDELDSLAYDSDVADPMQLAAAGLDGPEGAVDPYLWLPFNLKSEAEYEVGRYTFPSETTYSTETRLKLSVGGLASEYVCFCDTYAFPDRKQIPTSVGTVPSKLWVRPADTAPIVYIQLGEHVPPSMWLPVKPTAVAVRRVLAEFALVSAQHRDAHHTQWEERLTRAEIILRNNQMPRDDGSLLRFAAFEAQDVMFAVCPTREYPNFQEFFLGEYDDPRELIGYIKSCPFLFAIPHMQQEIDVHVEEHAPTIEGPGIGMGLYRTVYSKSSLNIKVHLATEVKLPPQDPESFELLWRDVEGRVIPKSRIPIFVRIMWPDHQRMAGGGKVIERFNKAFGTEFAPNMPIDAAMSVYYVMEWAKQMNNFLGIRGMRRRLDELLAAAQSPQTPLLYPGTHDVPNPQYTNDELIGMHIQYLAHLGDPEAGRAIRALAVTGSAPIRMGCAKAALEIGDRELFRQIVSSEPQGRMQHFMTKLVVKRKARDLTAKVPKLMEDQFEFGAPLWARGGTVRLDPSSLEGTIDIARMENTHRYGN